MALPATNRECTERRAALRPRLTDEFLATLVEALQLTMFDDHEVGGFVLELFEIAGKDASFE